MYSAATGAIGALSGILGTYAMSKKYFSDDKIIEKLDMILDEYTNNEEASKKIYSIGALLGKGVRDGVGIERMLPKKKGGFEALLMDIAGNFIGQRMGNMMQPQEQQPRQLTQKDEWK